MMEDRRIAPLSFLEEFAWWRDKCLAVRVKNAEFTLFFTLCNRVRISNFVRRGWLAGWLAAWLAGCLAAINWPRDNWKKIKKKVQTFLLQTCQKWPYAFRKFWAVKNCVNNFFPGWLLVISCTNICTRSNVTWAGNYEKVKTNNQANT